ncbi:MAG: hypothetical protein AMXMBFR81_05840 [Chthonomonas sp.]
MSETDKHAQRSSDVQESTWADAMMYLIPGIIAIVIGAVGLRYGEMFVGIGWVGIIGGVGATGFGLYKGFTSKKIEFVKVECVYCHAQNHFTYHPDDDFRCDKCQRLVPVLDGKVLSVEQVRCGFCNTLNYYSEKTEVLLCENCNREVPISLDEGRAPTKRLAPGYAVKAEDQRQFELRLIDPGPKTEEVIQTLQKMLALNRNQVKQMLEEVPITLLTGIPRMKAEMLQAQLAAHQAHAQAIPLD